MTRPRRRRVLAVLLALGVTAGVAAGGAWAAFTGSTSSAGNRVTAAPDFRAPTASASVVARSGGTVPGFVKPGGAYFVYANVADTGNPASGVSSVTADVSALTPGTTAAPLASGSFSAGGVTYGYRSASLTAGAGVTAGQWPTRWRWRTSRATRPFRRASAPRWTRRRLPASTSRRRTAAARSASAQPTRATRSSTPSASRLTRARSLAGWSGSATNVTVRLLNGTLIPTTNDSIAIYDATDATQLGLGINIGAGTGMMAWTPSAAALDRAGNPAATTVVNESGTADREF